MDELREKVRERLFCAYESTRSATKNLQLVDLYWNNVANDITEWYSSATAKAIEDERARWIKGLLKIGLVIRNPEDLQDLQPVGLTEKAIEEAVEAVEDNYVDKIIPRIEKKIRLNTAEKIIEILEEGAVTPNCTCGCWDDFKKKYLEPAP